MTNDMGMVVEQMEYSYTIWIQASDCELIILGKGEVKRGMALMGPVVVEWIEFPGSLC